MKTSNIVLKIKRLMASAFGPLGLGGSLGAHALMPAGGARPASPSGPPARSSRCRSGSAVLVATAALLTSVLLTFALGHLLGTASIGSPDANTVRGLVSIVVLIVFLMTWAQRESRQAPQAPANASSTEISDQEVLRCDLT